MKKFFLTALFVFVGAGGWWSLSRTARFSIKKWDAAFESVVRSKLSRFGLSNKDVLSSMHELKKDNRGEWVLHRLSLRSLNPEKTQDLKAALEASGAHVEEIKAKSSVMLSVRRGNRVYQEIHFIN